MGSRAVDAPRGALRALPAGARRGRPRVLGRPARGIEHGIGGIGKFERYFALFRARVLPLVHRRSTVHDLLQPTTGRGAAAVLRRALGHVALAPAVPDLLLALRDGPARPRSGVLPLRRGDVAASILERTRHALTRAGSGGQSVRALDPHRHARRRAALRASCRALRDDPRPPRSARVALPVGRGVPRAICPGASVDRFNLSDLFEYVSLEHYHRMLEAIVRRSRPRRAARLLEHAGAAAAARQHARPSSAARRPGRPAAPRRPRVLLQRLPRRGGRGDRPRSLPALAAQSLAGHRHRAGCIPRVSLAACSSTRARPAPARRRRGRCFTRDPACSRSPFRFCFARLWPVLLLTGASALLVAAVSSSCRRCARASAASRTASNRTTLGELYFPIVGRAAVLAHARRRTRCCSSFPCSMLTFADATGALVGSRYGMTRYLGASKSLEGSIAFVVIAFLCVHVPLLLWSDVGPRRIAADRGDAGAARDAARGERLAWPRQPLHPDRRLLPPARVPASRRGGAAAAISLVTVALVVLIVVARERTTLEDDSLVAGAFLCYVAWALMGWHWLVGPLAIVVGYRWLSPPTLDNSRRMHDVPAVLSVWAAAIGWLDARAHAAATRRCCFRTPSCSARTLRCSVRRASASQFPDGPCRCSSGGPS